MRSIFKWGLRLVLAVVVLAIVAVAIAYSVVTSTVPDKSGSAQMAGLGAPVRIVRDANWVPHVQADSYGDALQALGFAHAQDRFWQMHTLRMVAQGRLSEMFGNPTVSTDIFLKTLGIADASQKSWETLQPDTKALMETYTRGVNAWMTRDRGLMEPALPPEFLILGKDAEPWQPWHSLAILKVMALTLDGNMDREINRLALAAKGFGPREIDELLPYGPRDNPPPLPDLRTLYGFGPEGKPNAGKQRSKTNDHAFEMPWEIGITASNNWAVAGERTESGMPLLANDPHLGLQSPSVFYLAHVSFQHEGEAYNVVGGSLPGTPLILAGRNDHVAWGLTTTNLDSQDIFIERVKPDDPTQYSTPDGWESFETQTVTVNVSGGDPQTFELRKTRHGPVLPMGFRNLEAVLPGNHVAALSWASGAPDDTTMDAAIRLGLSKTVSQFQVNLRRLVAPMQSIVAADTAGNIGLIAPARVPLRDEANVIAGRAPVPGWESVYDWKGWLSFYQLPRINNPADSALATANANWMPSGYNQHITFDWDEHFRQGRVEELVVGANAKHSMQTMEAIQTDKFSPALVEFRDAALTQLEQSASMDEGMLTAFRDWDGMMAMDRSEPLILTAWWRHTQIGLLEDDLGDDYSRFNKGHLRPVIDMLTNSAARDWCDDRRTEEIESCGAILSQSLQAAVEELSSMQGADWTAWRWGKAHMAFGEHRPFSSVGALSRFFTVMPESEGGSYTLLRGRTDFGEDPPYYNRHASAFRALYDLSDLDASKYIISTGQSGHFLSPYYKDMADKWAGLEYVEVSANSEDYETGAVGVWNLEPAE